MYYNKKYFDEHNFLSISFSKTILDFMKKHHLKSLFDVGCGNGLMVKYLNNHHLNAKGCDIAKIAVKNAQKINKKNTIFQYSATNLKLKKNSFDVVTSDSVIEHLTPQEAGKFLQEARKILKPRGYLFLVTPNYATPLRIIQGKKWFGWRDPTHINFYTPKKLQGLLLRHQFTNLQKNFNVKYQKSFDTEFPEIFSKFPTLLKILAFKVFFSTPLSILRNSVWISAQKNDQEH